MRRTIARLLTTGLDVRSECEIRLAAGGVNRVDRYVLTQTLVTP
jgi:hypothetical protein